MRTDMECPKMYIGCLVLCVAELRTPEGYRDEGINLPKLNKVYTIRKIFGSGRVLLKEINNGHRKAGEVPFLETWFHVLPILTPDMFNVVAMTEREKQVTQGSRCVTSKWISERQKKRAH